MATKHLLVVLVVLSLVVPSVAGTVGAQTTRPADLAIQQPAYVGGDVEQTTQNGTRMYKVQGETLDIAPTNFNQSQVVDFGVEAGSGTLTYDSDFRSYTLRAENGTGTYELYWVVNERVSTGENSTEMATVRYTASIRVTGGIGLVHRPEGELAGLREDASNWRQFNSTIHSRDLAGPDADTQTVVQEMINWYKLRTDPLAALTGNFTAVVLLLVTSLGGAFVLLLFAIYHQAVIRRLYRALHIHEVTEAEEGAAKETIEGLEHREKLQALQNMDWNDIFNDDHVAAAFREQFGETVGDGTVEYLSMTRPRNILRDRLQVMGHDGYVAEVEKRASADGGAEDAATIVSARIVRADDVDDDTETVDLGTATDDELDPLLERDVLDWDATAIRTFDLSGADYDATELDTTFESMDLQSLIGQLRADMQHFEDPSAYGQYMREFLQAVRNHPFTDEQGRPDDLRYAMNAFLKHAQLLDDRFDYPLIHWHHEAWERAIIDYDPEQEAADLVESVRNGRGS